MAKAPVKKITAVRKKAVAKKAAPVRKKAVAKKAAPVRKKAVAKKAAPVRKKAVAKKAAPVRKKAVAKKAAPVRKKAVAKKAAPVRKKAAPVRKKAVTKKSVAKKAAPVRKKAVAKKAAPSIIRKIDLSPSSTVISEDKDWLQREAELPVFLKDAKSEIKKEPISTQGYSKKKSRKPAIIGFATVVVLLGVSLFSASSDSVTSTKPEPKKTTEVVAKESISPKSVGGETTTTPTPSKSATIEKPAKANLDSFAPRNFASSSEGQEISFTWIAPTKSSSVIGYELSTKKSGSNSWVVISSMTPQQLLVSVDLVSMDSTSQYKISSILENGKLAFNKAVLSHAGAVD